MKIAKILALLLSLAMLFCLVSCGEARKKEATGEEKAKVEIILMPQSGEKKAFSCTVSAEKSVKLIDLIKENPGWGFRWSSDYFVECFEGASPDAEKNEYIAIYTTDAEQGTGEPVAIEGNNFYYASLGITDMVLKDGETILFRVESF